MFKTFILSINNLITIPSTRYVVDNLLKKYHTKLNIAEVYIPIANKYFENNNLISFEYLNKKDKLEYVQTLKDKVIKYIKLVKLIYKINITHDNVIIITPDIQVLYWLFLIKRSTFKKNLIIIYLQFELIEDFRFGLINKYFFKGVIKQAYKIDIAIFPEINRKAYFLERCKRKCKNTFILPNSCEISIGSDIKHPLLKDIPDEAFIVGHVGVLGGEDHYYEEFFKAAQLLNNPNIYFVFFGRVIEQIKSRSMELKRYNILFFDSIPHHELAQIYPHFDIGLISYKGTSPNIEFCAPNKLYEYWSYGIPAIADKLKGLIPVFKTPIQGKLIDMGDPYQVKESILEIYQQNENRKSELQDYFQNHLRLSLYLEEFNKILDKVMISKFQN